MRIINELLFLFRKNKIEEDDISLINRFKKSDDKESIGILFERYTYLVYGICMKYLQNEEKCKDAVMEVFEKVMQELYKHEINNFSSWLHSVTRNYCLMQLRSEKSKIEKSNEWQKSELLFMEMTEEMHLNNTDEKEKQLQQLELAIEQLNIEQKACIKLFYIEEKSYQDVAAITGYSLKQVKSYLQNGKRNLENILRKNQW
ncbi:MAG: RNA polymerase sigma factor [Bacteroidia bacterium]